MNIRMHYKTVRPTQEMLDKILRYSAGGEELFEDANLNPRDEKWWTETTGHIAAKLKEFMDVEKSTDHEIAASIPESAYMYCRDDREKAKVVVEYVKMARAGGSWLLPLGFLIRDCQRLEMEAMRMGDRVIRARSQLRAFAVAIAMALGCASLVETEDEF